MFPSLTDKKQFKHEDVYIMFMMPVGRYDFYNVTVSMKTSMDRNDIL